MTALPCCTRFTLLALLLAATAARAAEPKKYFPPDAPDTPAFTLPDPLRTESGRPVTSAADWKSLRRPEVLELFRKYVYGRVPATPYRKSFHVREDRHAMGGAATLKQITITIEADGIIKMQAGGMAKIAGSAVMIN